MNMSCQWLLPPFIEICMSVSSVSYVHSFCKAAQAEDAAKDRISTTLFKSQCAKGLVAEFIFRPACCHDNSHTSILYIYSTCVCIHTYPCRWGGALPSVRGCGWGGALPSVRGCGWHGALPSVWWYYTSIDRARYTAHAETETQDNYYYVRTYFLQNTTW